MISTQTLRDCPEEKPGAHLQGHALETEPFLNWTFGKWDQKPTFENEIGDDRHAKRHGYHCQPAVFAEPSHEPADEDDRGDIQTKIRHRANVDRSRHNDTHNLAQLSPLGEQS